MGNGIGWNKNNIPTPTVYETSKKINSVSPLLVPHNTTKSKTKRGTTSPNLPTFSSSSSSFENEQDLLNVHYHTLLGPYRFTSSSCDDQSYSNSSEWIAPSWFISSPLINKQIHTIYLDSYANISKSCVFLHFERQHKMEIEKQKNKNNILKVLSPIRSMTSPNMRTSIQKTKVVHVKKKKRFASITTNNSFLLQEQQQEEEKKKQTVLFTPDLFFANTFYDNLFLACPKLKQLINPEEKEYNILDYLKEFMKEIYTRENKEKEKKLITKIREFITYYSKESSFITLNHYNILGKTLLETIEYCLGVEFWNEQIKMAWINLYSKLLIYIIPIVKEITNSNLLLVSK